MKTSRLFLPFTPQAKATELQAISVKERLRAGPYDSVDPYSVLPSVPARVLGEEYFETLSEPARAALLGPAGEVSALGFGKSPATGEDLIFVNPSHHPNRQRVSLMEEIVHIVLDHPKSVLSCGKGPAGKWTRTHNPVVEDEAYSVGAACIIPYRALFNAVNDDHTRVEELAARYRVSEDYIKFRIKRAGLSRVYAKHCA